MTMASSSGKGVAQDDDDDDDDGDDDNGFSSQRLPSKGTLEKHKNDDDDDDDDECDHDNDDKPEKGCIYLDYNGTTPVHPQVLAAMMPFLSTHFGNPSSGHAYGSRPKEAVRKARRAVYGLLEAPPLSVSSAASDSRPAAETERELEKQQYQLQKQHQRQWEEYDARAQESIVFTGCGTESDNMAILLALESTRHLFQADTDASTAADRQKPHVVTSNVEHPAVAECLSYLQSRGDIDVTYVPVTKNGICPADAVMAAIRPHGRTILVTLMLANNESGALQPVSDVARHCRDNGVLFHTDAAQAVGKVSVSLDDMGRPDMVTLVGHKFGAPKGIAALYVRPGCLLECGRRNPGGYGHAGALLLGGGQEGGRRAGTENVPYIVGMGKAAHLLTTNGRWKDNAMRMERLRFRLLDKLHSRLVPVLIEEGKHVKEISEGNDASIVRPNGPDSPSLRLPNTLSVGIRGVQSGELLRAVSSRVAASAGSACHASGGGISAVLRAMKVPEVYAAGTLRLSVGPDTTEEEVDKAADILAEEALRQLGRM